MWHLDNLTESYCFKVPLISKETKFDKQITIINSEFVFFKILEVFRYYWLAIHVYAKDFKAKINHIFHIWVVSFVPQISSITEELLTRIRRIAKQTSLHVLLSLFTTISNFRLELLSHSKDYIFYWIKKNELSPAKDYFLL